jgi:phosphoribosylanthranilate isomerase
LSSSPLLCFRQQKHRSLHFLHAAHVSQVVAACDAAGITIAQLHGDGARRALLQMPERIRAIYVLTADASGAITTPLPGELNPDGNVNALAGEQGWRKAVDWLSRGRRTVDWLLVDGQVPGSGHAYDWRALNVPKGASRKGWLLAGGLTPDNVGDALSAARPDGVDVASGVAAADGVTKDPALVTAFIEAAVNPSRRL